MQLSRLHLHQFRSHSDAEFEFDPHITAIIGPNGSGKTNILEAIYTLCMGKSFRDGDDELITYTQDWYRIEGQIDDTVRELRYQPSNKGKQLIVDGTTKGRFTYRQQLPVVLFEPDDLLMIHNSPSTRRHYIDTLLMKITLNYHQTVLKYERALLQRNNLLKKGLSAATLSDSLFGWDIALSSLGAEIVQARTRMVAEMNNVLTGYYQGITQKNETITMGYQTQTSGETSDLARLLAQHLPHDRERGFTTVGPHRDDIEFLCNGRSMKTTASRGEVRTLLLALKFAEIAMIKQNTNTSPLLLLDDVFSELDITRQKTLIAQTKDAQKIITTTHLPRDISSTVKTLIELTHSR